MFASRSVRIALFIGAAVFGLFSGTTQAAEPLKIGYSDWPGWVAW